MKIIGAILRYALTFWAGGVFTLAVTFIDRNGGLTNATLMKALYWPVAYYHWLLK